MRLRLALYGLVLAVAAAAAFYKWGRGVWHPVLAPLRQQHTVASRLATLGPAVDERLAPRFAAAGVTYPPARGAFVAFKKERVLELWAASTATSPLVPVHAYPVHAASGGPGPKLAEGDRQVPEGRYAVEYLNPNSSYHLSIKIDYPNAKDRARAAADGRTKLGGDIFIHGKAVSIGCLAMGDEAAEELFVLVAKTGAKSFEVHIAPEDFRDRAAPSRPEGAPAWVDELYAEIAADLVRFRR